MIILLLLLIIAIALAAIIYNLFCHQTVRVKVFASNEIQKAMTYQDSAVSLMFKILMATYLLEMNDSHLLIDGYVKGVIKKDDLPFLKAESFVSKVEIV